MTQNKLFFRYLPPILWMVVIFFFSSRPDLPKNQFFLLDFFFKKSAHILEYFILLLLWHKALGQKTPATAFLISLLYAFTDETHQLFVPGRGGLLQDVAIDSIGLLTSLLVITKYSNGKSFPFQHR